MDKNEREKIFYETTLDNIRKGIYQFKDVGSKQWKKEYEETLLKEINNGNSNDNIINALVNYQIDLLAKKKRTIDEIPIELKDKVIEKMSNI